MKKNATPKKKRRKQRQHPKWQSGPYSRRATFNFILPGSFLALCRLADVTPETVLHDFIHNLAHGSYRREERYEARGHLVNYFLAHGYGQQHYTEHELLQMFRELDALASLFPRNAKTALLDSYVTWSKKHETYWFKGWVRKPRRRLQKPDSA